MLKNIRSSKAVIGVIMALGLLAFIFSQVYTGKPSSGRIKTDKNTVDKSLLFKKEGELVIIRNDTDTISQIDIEYANNPYKIERGLMYRKEMQINQGMLFIMPIEKMQSFWMKNTFLPLDIIFIDGNGIIGSVQKNTEPFSMASLPSELPAKYVLEVNAGFWDKFGLEKGDKIVFKSI